MERTFVVPIFLSTLAQGMKLNPKSIDVVVAVTVGVVISVYKLGPLLKDITDKERAQLEARKNSQVSNSQ